MSAFGPERLAMLVQPDRVHRSVYADPAIFDLEMERVFGRAWLALGHESQVRNVGDYFTTRMGREPVIVIRKSEDQIGVLINRCVHRGSMVCAEGRGNAERIRDREAAGRPEGRSPGEKLSGIHLRLAGSPRR